MISKYIVFFLTMIILPDIYIYWYKIHRQSNRVWWKTVLLVIPTIFMLGFTLYLASKQGFVGDSQQQVETYLLLFGLIVSPKGAYALCSSVGHLACRFLKKRFNWGNLLGLVLVLYCVYMVLIGFFYGFKSLQVKEQEIAFADLPEKFDGYRIVLFSDAHVGSYYGKRSKLLDKIVDEINNQKGDIIVFAGDLQNVQPQEIYPHRNILRQLKAPDGVVSVLGNHDYSAYSDASPAECVANEKELQSLQRQFGWNLLMNDHITIRRGNDSIVVAGLENHGKTQHNEELRRRFPQRGDVDKALKGVDSNAFVIMVEHDPSAWRELILPKSNAKLTLSGHTHGGQVRPFGLSLTDYVYKESRGLYWEADRSIFVTSGLGGLIPFRYGVTPEIVVITLKKK